MSPRPPLEASRVLCIAPHWVGDSLFFLPAVDALRRRFSGAAFGLLAKPGIVALLKDSGRFDRVHPLPSGAGRWARFHAHWALRKEKYDLAVVFPDSFSSAFAAALSGARVRAGRSCEGRGLLLSSGLRLPRRRRDRHVVDEYLELAEACGAAAVGEERDPAFTPSEAGAREFRESLKARPAGDGPLVGLCPTSAYGPAKQWPPERWSALARALKSRGFAPIFFCAPDEKKKVESIAAAAGGLAVLAPTLAGLAAGLKACETVVANDSGPLHLAAAVGARCLGLYGPVDPAWSGPRSPRARSLYLDLDCSPCHARVCPLKHQDCLRRISVERVLAALEEAAEG